MKKNSTLILLVILTIINTLGVFASSFYFFDKFRNIENKEEIEEKEEIKTVYAKYDFDYSWVENNKYICHALGGIENDVYTNSKEAFILNYEKGHRVFEVDLDLTEDGELVCSHDIEKWKELTGVDVDYTYNNFKNIKLLGKYTSMDIDDLVNAIRDYADINIITDTKYTDEESIIVQFSRLVEKARSVDEKILDRVVPQVYDLSMLDTIMEIYPFKSVVLTLYQYDKDWNNRDIAAACLKTGVKLVTCSMYEADDVLISFWEKYGVDVAVFTVNDLGEANSFFNSGIKMIYTDFLVS